MNTNPPQGNTLQSLHALLNALSAQDRSLQNNINVAASATQILSTEMRHDSGKRTMQDELILETIAKILKLEQKAEGLTPEQKELAEQRIKLLTFMEKAVSGRIAAEKKASAALQRPGSNLSASFPA